MAAIYPIDYPFNVDGNGWPEPVYAPPYPFEHYHDNGRNPRQIQRISKIQNDSQHQPNVDYVLPVAIRRHRPGSTNPNLPQLSTRSHSPPVQSRLPVKRNVSQPNSRAVSVQNHVSTSTDPDERPIKPMKDISVYNQSSSKKRPFQPKNPPPQTPKTVQPSPRYELDSFRAPQPPPPSRTPVSTVFERRPIRIDLIPKTPFGIVPKRNRSRRIIVEEYEDDYDYTVEHVKPIPKKILSYQKVTGMTTRELENHRMSKPRPTVRVRSPPVERIIYRN